MNTSHQHHHKWADVALYENLADAQLLVQHLEDQGLEARAYDDKVYRAFLFLRPPQVTYRIQVRSDHVVEAVKFLITEQPAVLARAVHCPDCGSLEINYPQMTRRFVLPTVLLHLGILLRIVNHEAYCEACHYTWELVPRKQVVLPQLKPLGR